jgi:hypothetical protein
MDRERNVPGSIVYFAERPEKSYSIRTAGSFCLTVLGTAENVSIAT